MSIQEVKEKRIQLLALGTKTYPNALVSTRTIDDTDIEVLYDIVSKYKPATILEIGSWIGTSAMVMDAASLGGATIRTCDKNNVYVYDSKNVTYYNMVGEKFLRLMAKHISADMIFIDASMASDMKRVLKAMAQNFTFVVHDFVKDKKGWKNAKAMQRLIGGINMIKPSEGSSIAYAEVRR